MSYPKHRKSPPPFTEEHKLKLRNSNKKTWANPELLKIHTTKTKEALANRTPEEKAKWLENMTKACRTPQKRRRAREIMLKLRENPVWIKKSEAGRAKAFKGKGNPFYGKKHDEKTIKIISKSRKGLTAREKNPNWRGGITHESRLARVTPEYYAWRTAVFKRDNYTCVLCKDSTSNRLNADHIKPFWKYKELRYEVTNGRTLCIPCHRKTDTYGTKALKII